MTKRKYKKQLLLIGSILLLGFAGCGKTVVTNPADTLTKENNQEVLPDKQEAETPTDVPATQISPEQEEIIQGFSYEMPWEGNGYVVEIPGGMEVYFDLDGDGVDECLYYATEVNPESDNRQVSLLRINQEEYQNVFQGLSVEEQYFGIVDLQEEDAYLELALYDTNAKGENQTRFFRYQGDSLVEIGTVPKFVNLQGAELGEAYLDGNGNIYSTFGLYLVQNWEAAGVWSLADSGQIQMVQEEFYIPLQSSKGQSGTITVKNHFLVYMESDVESDCAFVEYVGSPVSFQVTDNGEWMFVSVAGGATGWLHCKDGYQVEREPGKFVPSTEVFDNLNY